MVMKKAQIRDLHQFLHYGHFAYSAIAYDQYELQNPHPFFFMIAQRILERKDAPEIFCLIFGKDVGMI